MRGAAKNARHSKKEPRKRRSGMPAKGARIGRIGAPSRSHVRGAKRGKAAQRAEKRPGERPGQEWGAIAGGRTRAARPRHFVLALASTFRLVMAARLRRRRTSLGCTCEGDLLPVLTIDRWTRACRCWLLPRTFLPVGTRVQRWQLKRERVRTAFRAAQVPQSGSMLHRIASTPNGVAR